MAISGIKKLGAILILAGIISLVFSGVFVFQSINASNLLTEAMCLEKATYGSADGAIDGIIDTPTEAQVMANTLREHRLESYGYYSELDREDPNRDIILKAMTMENSLNLAQVGYGLADVVKYTGIFMALLGAFLVVGGVFVIRSGRQNLQSG